VFQARYIHYLSTRAQLLASKARRDKLKSSTSKIDRGIYNFDIVQPSDKKSCNPMAQESRSRGLADALLHDDTRPGYAGPGMVSLGSEGTLTLAREFPRMILCLKIFYVYEVDPIWNIPLRAVTDLKNWLNRQFLASQEIIPMPKMSPRAMTTLNQIWEILAEFDANAEHISAITRATPTDLASRIPIVEASVVPQTRPTQAAANTLDVEMVARDCPVGSSNHIAYVEPQNQLSPAGRIEYHNPFTERANPSLQCKNRAQQAEIVRLTKSISKYSSRVRAANDNIRSLRNELRDLQNHNTALQDKYDGAKKRVKMLVDDRAGTTVSHTFSQHEGLSLVRLLRSF
jgi:hypothetical protein